MKYTYLSIMVMLFFVLSSFDGTKTFKRTNWIPSDFDSRNNVLLVENAEFNVPPKRNAKLQLQMQDIMQKEYPYKYEFASSKEIVEGKKFADKDKYRWALLSTTITTSETMGTMTVNGVDFHLYDRKSNKQYKETGYTDSFLGRVMPPTVATLVKYLKELKK